MNKCDALGYRIRDTERYIISLFGISVRMAVLFFDQGAFRIPQSTPLSPLPSSCAHPAVGVSEPFAAAVVIPSSFSIYSFLLLDDEIFSRHCIVFLKFTPKSNILSSVSIQWESDVGSDVLALLIEKYGNPAYQNNKITDKQYAWDNGEKAILLNYDKFKTLLSYGEKEAQKKGLKEQQEINRKEIEKF